MLKSGKLFDFNVEKGIGHTKCDGYLGKILVDSKQLKTGILKDGIELYFNVVKGSVGWEAEEITTAMTIEPPLPIPNIDNVHDITASRKYVSNRQNQNSLHLYMPWNPGYISDQMYQLKNKLSEKRRAWIPKINSTQGKVDFNPEIIEVLKEQLTNGVETCLYMTNFNCIHIWKISDIYMGKDLPAAEQEATLTDYSKKGHVAEFWVQVSDVYVLQADHDGKLTPILQELEKLSICDLKTMTYDPKSKITPYMSAQRYPAPVAQRDKVQYFTSVIKTQFAGDEVVVTTGDLWLNTHRKVTKEYNLMHEHMKKNVYPNMWESFNKRSQHFLIELEMLKIESAAYSFLQSLQYSKQIFECYISALLNELDEMVAQKLIVIAKHYEIPKILYNENSHDSLERFKGTGEPADLTFYRNLLTDASWKNNLGKIKASINNPTVRDEIIQILELAQNYPLTDKISTLTKLRNWFAHDYFRAVSFFVKENHNDDEKELVASLTTILNLISSPYSTHNLFCDLYRLKNKNSKINFNDDFDKLVCQLKTICKKAA